MPDQASGVPLAPADRSQEVETTDNERAQALKGVVRFLRILSTREDRERCSVPFKRYGPESPLPSRCESWSGFAGLRLRVRARGLLCDGVPGRGPRARDEARGVGGAPGGWGWSTSDHEPGGIERHSVGYARLRRAAIHEGKRGIEVSTVGGYGVGRSRPLSRRFACAQVSG